MNEDALDHSLLEFFEHHAARDPDHQAVSNERGSLTYGRLAALTDRIAAAVIHVGVKPGDRVVLVFGSCAEAIAAMLGVVKAGAIAVPLNSTSPVAHLRRVIEHAQPACVVTEPVSVSSVGESLDDPIPIVDVDALPALAALQWPRLDPAAACIVLYTSGSTGAPKGVLQSHRSITRKILAARTTIGARPHDRYTLFSTYSVGQGLTAIFTALLHGATVCMFDVRRHGFDRLARWLRDERISIYHSSASLFRSLAATAGAGLVCPSLRVLRLGSERITAADIDTCRARFPTGVMFVVAYSSTETSTVTFHVVHAEEDFGTGPVPVGLALAGVRVSIVDDQGRDVPSGETGEIAVHGADLPLGYFRDEALTARRYQSSADVPGERRCLTGDLGRLRPDGRLEHLGRKDRLVKIRGFRIELDEVEAALLQHPQVSAAAVEARPDRSGDTVLAAYLEGPPGLPVEALRGFLAERLADYKIPSRFIRLDRLPMSDSGKVARSRLPALDDSAPAAGPAPAPTETGFQAVVLAVWMEVLGLDTIGLDDSFFMVGGDSLRAAKVASRLSVALGAEVPLTLLLEADTVRRLSETLEAQGFRVRLS